MPIEIIEGAPLPPKRYCQTLEAQEVKAAEAFLAETQHNASGEAALSVPQRTWGWKPGVSGNAKGKPKGVKNRISREFLERLAADFSEHGESVIARVRAYDPVAYLKIVRSIVPASLLVKVEDGSPIEELGQLSDEEFAELYLAKQRGEAFKKALER